MAPLLLFPFHMHRLVAFTFAFGLISSCSTSGAEDASAPQDDVADTSESIGTPDASVTEDVEPLGPELPTAEAPPRRKFGTPVTSARHRGRVSIGPEAVVGAVSSPRHAGRIGHAVGPSFTLLPREDAQ